MKLNEPYEVIPGAAEIFVLCVILGLQNKFRRAKRPFFASFCFIRFILSIQLLKYSQKLVNFMNLMKSYEVMVFKAFICPV